MRVAILHHNDRAWPRVLNHLDGRECPTCHATIHGQLAQRAHKKRHLDEAVWRNRVNELVEEMAKRTGLTEELVELAGDDWSWGAEVEGGADE